MLALTVACAGDPSPSAPDVAGRADARDDVAGADRAGADDGSALEDASDLAVDGGSDVEAPCEGVRVGVVTGRLLDTQGRVPTAGLVTLCGSLCIARDLGVDGAFAFEGPWCFRRGTDLPRPVLLYHGGGAYTDYVLDFVPPDASALVGYDFGAPLRVVAAADMATAVLDPATATRLEDGQGFVLEAAPGAAHLPFGATTLGAVRLPVDEAPPIPGVDGLAALWATFPGEARFDPPARLALPNVAGLAAGAPVELLGIGTLETAGVYPGTLGAVALAHVSADGATIETDATSGLDAFPWIGYRAPQQE